MAARFFLRIPNAREALGRAGDVVWHFRLTRDVLLFTFGAVGFFHELFFTYNAPERPFILTVSAAMMGLPLILRTEDRLRDGKDDDDDLSGWGG